jgi:hypothetical protein
MILIITILMLLMLKYFNLINFLKFSYNTNYFATIVKKNTIYNFGNILSLLLIYDKINN